MNKTITPPRPFALTLLATLCLATLPNALAAESGWQDHPILGATYVSDSAWHYHAVHGWLWVADESPEWVRAYSNRWGWLAYGKDSYPNAWSYDWRTWYGPESLRDNDAWIYDHWADAWYAASDTPRQRLQRRTPAIMRHVQSCIDLTTTRLGSNRSNFPDYTGLNAAYGNWLLRPATWWSAGFFPALLWLNANYTEDPADAEAARLWTSGLVSQVGTDHYDAGFLIGLPFRKAFEFTGITSYRAAILNTCSAFNTRFSDTTNAFRHWTFGRFGTPPNFVVIIDSLMNMEMLYWGARNGGFSTWADNAATHATTIGDVNVRADGSTYHWTIFNENDGSLIDQGTQQGYADDSTWSRGQAWAIYGFTIAYRETNNPRFLDLARKTTDFFLANLPEDAIPPADFDDPVGPEAGAKDSSAAAIAAAGLQILASLETDPLRAATYTAAAARMLLRLSHPDYLSTEVPTEAVLLQGSPRYGDNLRGTTFGDYYFVEAILQ